MATGAPLTDTRIVNLDMVRGIAVMSILLMNIAAFAMPEPAYFNPMAYGGSAGIDWLTWAVEFVFIDSKMRGLFSVLFGASTLLVIERAAKSARSPVVAHYARMGWLLVFGLAHFYFIWWGDILALYALVGLLLFFFRNLSVKVLRRWIIGLLTAQLLFMGVQGAALTAAQTGNLPPQARNTELEKGVEQVNRFFGSDTPRIAEDLAHYRSDYSTIMRKRLVDETTKPLIAPVQFGLETLALMLIGMALFRSGMLTGDWEPARYRKWAIRCFAISVPPLALLLWYMVAIADYQGTAMFATSFAWSMPFDVIMTIGWAALIANWAKRSAGLALGQRVAAAGRMAFTNYLMTSIVMTTIFYGYGLNLFGDVSRAGLLLFVAGMWGLMLAWSKPWLERFNYGPFEWLWRSLARFSMQPMRKRNPQPIAEVTA